MKDNEFKNFLNQIRPCSDQAAVIWLEWAKELECYDSSHGELPEGEFKTTEEFLGIFAEKISDIQEKHGTEIAQKIISLAEISACPFPCEIEFAAEYLAAGGDVSEIARLESEGMLEDEISAMQM